MMNLGMESIMRGFPLTTTSIRYSIPITFWPSRHHSCLNT